MKHIEATLLFYESPHRLKDTLSELLSAFGDRPMTAARELTKKFEEFRRGTISELLAHFREEAPRGEFTLIVSGAEEAEAAVPQTEMTVEEELTALIESGCEKKDAIRQVAQRRELPKREVYQIALSLYGN